MKKIIEKFKDYRYRKRVLKFFTVNIKLLWRDIKRFFKSEKFRRGIVSVPAIMSYISVFIIALIITGSAVYTKYVSHFFESGDQIIRRLSMTEYNSEVPYLTVLDAIGSSNRIQVTLKTDDENYILPKGVDLDKGSINMILTFSDGKTTEFSLDNANYDNFESGMTDTFTLILPFGYTPFDIIDYTIIAVPDINNNYDSWHCKWARVYFLLGDEQVMLAKESWESTAVFGSGDGNIRSSALSIVHSDNNSYKRTQKLYSHYLALANAGMTDFSNIALKEDALDSLSLNGGKYIYVDIETVDIEIQNDILTYYTKGVNIAETDALDYDGLMYLEVEFYTAKADGSYTETYTLDTLGTDDYELGTTSSFQLEMPEGMTVFDIRGMSLYTDNPYDSWAPRYVRVYIKPDFGERLEIARLNDTLLVNTYTTPVFYKNLIDSPVSLDLSSQFALAEATKLALEKQYGYSLGTQTSKMYFELQSFYDRQIMFYDKLIELYSESVYEQTEEQEIPEQETAENADNEGASLGEIAQTDQSQTEQAQPEQSQTEQAQPEQPQTEQVETEQPEPVQTEPEQSQTEQTQTEQTQPEQTQSEQTQSEQTQSEQTQSEQTQSEETQPEQEETVQPEQTQTEQTQPEQSQPEQSQTEQEEPSQEDIQPEQPAETENTEETV